MARVIATNGKVHFTAKGDNNRSLCGLAKGDLKVTRKPTSCGRCLAIDGKTVTAKVPAKKTVPASTTKGSKPGRATKSRANGKPDLSYADVVKVLKKFKHLKVTPQADQTGNYMTVTDPSVADFAVALWSPKWDAEGQNRWTVIPGRPGYDPSGYATLPGDTKPMDIAQVVADLFVAHKPVVKAAKPAKSSGKAKPASTAADKKAEIDSLVKEAAKILARASELADNTLADGVAFELAFAARIVNSIQTSN